MARRSIANDFYSFVGTLFFSLFVLILASAPSAGADSVGLTARLGLSALLLVGSFYVLESGRRAGRNVRVARRPIVVEPVIKVRRGPRAA